MTRLTMGIRASDDPCMKKLLILLFIGCAACTMQARDPATAPPGEAVATANSADVLTDIRQAIGEAACSTSAQCRTLPVGAKACGGPQEYLAWSTSRGDQKALEALAERSKALRQEEIKRSGEMSICMHIPDPGASCVAGTCQLRTAAPGV